MPLIPFETPRIVIDIPDLEIDSTVIKRQAEVFTLLYNQNSKEVAVTYTVKHYSDCDGQPGEYMGKTIVDWSKETIADNTTMCNTENGHPIEKLPEGDPDADENGYPRNLNYMGQYDFFYMLAQTQPVQIHSLIIQFGQLVQSWEKK